MDRETWRAAIKQAEQDREATRLEVRIVGQRAQTGDPDYVTAVKNDDAALQRIADLWQMDRLRDQAALAALTGLLAKSPTPQEMAYMSKDRWADIAYQFADAILGARDRSQHTEDPS